MFAELDQSVHFGNIREGGKNKKLKCSVVRVLVMFLPVGRHQLCIVPLHLEYKWELVKCLEETRQRARGIPTMNYHPVNRK